MDVIKKIVASLLMIIEVPLTFFSAKWVKHAINSKKSEKIFMEAGVYPIIDHYYFPLINPKKYLKNSLRDDRHLPGINLNIDSQLKLLEIFDYNNELTDIPIEGTGNTHFYYNNGMFESGDAEYLYNIIRKFKPKRIIEIGSGFTTILMAMAINKNKKDNPEYNCNLVCVDPNLTLKLEDYGAIVIKESIESLDIKFFKGLEKNDILFIDSSHVIRPQGDVLFEYLEVLPTLNTGVLIHSHDIFTPKDYLDDWVINQHLMWNEQYLLEALLTNNLEFRIIGALNFLAHNHHDMLAEKSPVYAIQKNREPGSFWIVKN